jgi:hypothetical protein
LAFLVVGRENGRWREIENGRRKRNEPKSVPLVGGVSDRRRTRTVRLRGLASTKFPIDNIIDSNTMWMGFGG